MTTVLAAENILWFDVAVGDAVLMTIIDGGKNLQECIADLVLLGAIVIRGNSVEKIAAAVEVEYEKISREAAVDAVVAETNVGIQGNGVSNVFVTLDVLLCVKLLG